MQFDDFLLHQGVDVFQRASTPLVQLLLEHHERYDMEPLDWDRIIHDAISMASIDTFKCVVAKSISPRVESLEWQPWKEEIQQEIRSISQESLKSECWIPPTPTPRQSIEVVGKIQSKLATFERRTMMILMELFCWKCRVQTATNNSDVLNETVAEEDDDIRANSRIHSGAESIVPIVLSFL